MRLGWTTSKYSTTYRAVKTIRVNGTPALNPLCICHAPSPVLKFFLESKISFGGYYSWQKQRTQIKRRQMQQLLRPQNLKPQKISIRS